MTRDERSRAELERVVEAFCPGVPLISVIPYGNGHIHSTFLADLQAAPDRREQIILQRINTTVFRHPETLVRNLHRVTQHLTHSALGRRSLRVPALKLLSNGQPLFGSEEAGFWRVFDYLDGTHSIQVCESAAVAAEAAAVLGEFQRRLSDLPAPRLEDTIPRFQDSNWRYENFLRAVAEDRAGRSAEAADLIDFARIHQRAAQLLSDGLASGVLPERVSHADPKITNFLFDDDGRGVALVDLDTCMMGTVLYDFGDFVRSVCPSCDEDEPDVARIAVREDFLEAAVVAYLSAVGDVLSESERLVLPKAPAALALTLGVRFLTDFLEGDWYFKTRYPDHNFVRARAQLTLASRFAALEGKVSEIVARI